METVFHYTNLESLALILKNRTLRFSRLDGVDDMTESQCHAGIAFGRCLFVSCWTQDAIESIPQWHIYGRGMQGVRIELPIYPFRLVEFKVPATQTGISVYGPIVGPLSYEESIGESHCVVPDYFDGNFAGPVTYVTDVGAEYRRLVRDEIDESGSRIVTTPPFSRLARIKSAQWCFQKEYRFVLAAVPRRRGQPVSQLVLSGEDPGIRYLDVPVSPTALEKLVVRMGPLCTDAQRACVEAILSKWAPSASLETSALRGAIRAR